MPLAQAPNAFSLFRLMALLPCLFATLLFPPSATATDWDPVPQADLSLRECVSTPGAHAEILLQRQVMDSDGRESWRDFYTRIKIYSPRAAEELGVLGIEYYDFEKIWDVAARVIKPDGRITVFKESSFNYSKERTKGILQINRSALAVPDLSEGDIIEFKWSQSASQYASTYFWQYCQTKVPVREYLFKVASSPADYSIYWYTPGKMQLRKADKNSTELIIKDIPAYDEEPCQPPTRDVRGWFMVLYTYPDMRTKWEDISMYEDEGYHYLTKASDAINAKTAALLAGASGNEEKLRRIYAFCQEEIGNLTYFVSSEHQEATRRQKKSGHEQTPEETLKRGKAYPDQINELFAAMAKAAGFEVRKARGASRRVSMNVMHAQGWVLMTDDFAAIKTGETWKLYAPGDYYVPFGLTAPENQLVKAAICDGDKPVFITIPADPAAASLVDRQARLRLDEEGNLEGEVRLSLGGHEGAFRQQRWARMQDKDIDAEYREEFTQRLPSAEITGITWENRESNKLPLMVRFHLKVPAYADFSGPKMIFSPNIFACGAPPLFTAPTRQTSILFDHAWSEHDDIEIVLPEGYTLDTPSAPKDIGNTAAVLGSSYKLGWKGKSRTLTYKRDFALGANALIAFPAQKYSSLKELFEQINRSDEHCLMIKPATPNTAAAGAP